MVRAFLTKEVRNINAAALIIATFTLLSQLLGLVRDRLLAGNFGASNTLDIYYAAFKVPDFLMVTFASLVSISVLVPFLADRLQSGEGSAKRFIDNVFSAFSVCIVVVAGVIAIILPHIAGYIFPGFVGDGQLMEQYILLTRIMLLSPVLLGFSNLFASIVQIHNRFLVYALAPVLYNLGIIFGIVVLYPLMGISGLALGVVAGAVLHLAIHVPVAVETNLVPRLKIFRFSQIKEVVRTSIPRALALSTSTISLIVLTAIASLLIEGSIAVLNLSLNLQSVPLALIGASYSVASFAPLSRLYVTGDRVLYSRRLTDTLRKVILLALPLTALFIVLRAQIVRVVLGTGAFDWQATRLTAAMLGLFVLSACAQSIVLVLTRAMYARGNTKVPVTINMISAAFIIILAWLLVPVYSSTTWLQNSLEGLLSLQSLPSTTVIVLPLAYTIGSWLNAGLLLWQAEATKRKEVLIAFAQSLGTAIVVFITSYAVLYTVEPWFDTTRVWGLLWQAALSGLAGGLMAVGLYTSLGISEIKDVWYTMRSHLTGS